MMMASSGSGGEVRAEADEEAEDARRKGSTTWRPGAESTGADLAKVANDLIFSLVALGGRRRVEGEGE